jgi:hypothetical protein
MQNSENPQQKYYNKLPWKEKKALHKEFSSLTKSSLTIILKIFDVIFILTAAVLIGFAIYNHINYIQTGDRAYINRMMNCCQLAFLNLMIPMPIGVYINLGFYNWLGTKNILIKRLKNESKGDEK